MYRILLIAVLCFVAVSAQADDDANAKLFEVHSRLAAMGSAEAQFKLGEMCEEGRGTPRDLVKAREWYEKAAQQGHEEAKRRLETLGKRKISDDADKMAQEVQLIKKRAEEERQAALTQKREEEDRRIVEERKREDERTRQVQAQKRMEDEQKAKLAAQQRKQEEEKARASMPPQPVVQKPPQPVPLKVPAAATSSATVTDNKDESFESDPCKSAAARFMSTCH